MKRFALLPFTGFTHGLLFLLAGGTLLLEEILFAASCALLFATRWFDHKKRSADHDMAPDGNQENDGSMRFLPLFFLLVVDSILFYFSVCYAFPIPLTIARILFSVFPVRVNIIYSGVLFVLLSLDELCMKCGDWNGTESYVGFLFLRVFVVPFVLPIEPCFAVRKSSNDKL